MNGYTTVTNNSKNEDLYINGPNYTIAVSPGMTVTVPKGTVSATNPYNGRPGAETHITVTTILKRKLTPLQKSIMYKHRPKHDRYSRFKNR